jgi:hypothetical protein
MINIEIFGLDGANVVLFFIELFRFRLLAHRLRSASLPQRSRC